MLKGRVKSGPDPAVVGEVTVGEITRIRNGVTEGVPPLFLTTFTLLGEESF